MAVRFNKSFNINRVVKRLVRSVLALYVGGTIMTTFGTVMTNTSSPFYSGLSLIGWTVGATGTNGTAGWYYYCSDGGAQSVYSGSAGVSNCITATSGSGVLAVVGIIAIAQIVTEFINW